jgi:hypothetical protein
MKVEGAFVDGRYKPSGGLSLRPLLEKKCPLFQRIQACAKCPKDHPLGFHMVCPIIREAEEELYG